MKKYNEMTEKDYNTIFPSSNLEYLNSLTGTQKDTYLILNGLYRSLLNQYLKQLVLGNYDKILSSSDLSFVPVATEEQDFYQYYSNNDLKYYYVRNNIFVERLSDEELNYLKSRIITNNFTLQSEDVTFVRNTFSKVIKEEDIDGKAYVTNFGPDSSTFHAQSNSLVIGFRYDEFNLNDMTEEKWAQNNNKQREFLWNFNNQLEMDLKQKLNIPVSVIEYDEYSIKNLEIKSTNDAKRL